MTKDKKRKNLRFKATWSYSTSSTPQIEDMSPEDLMVSIRRAEKEALPVIQRVQAGPAAALFLLAQYTYVFATGSQRLTEETATRITNTLLSLWQEGTYVPTRKYPFTLKETLQDMKKELKAEKDYTDSFQPFAPQRNEQPRGIGQLSGGIVKHPETHLWQIWIMMDERCTYVAAYHDPLEAQRNLEEIVLATRKGGTRRESEALSMKVQSRGSGQPRQIPLDMMSYLLEHIERYTIHL